MCHGYIYGGGLKSSNSYYDGGLSPSPEKVECTNCWEKVDGEIIKCNALRTIYKCPSCKKNFKRKTVINKVGSFLIGVAIAHIGGDILHDSKW